MEYLIWNDTDIWKSAHLEGADSVLRLSVLKEVWISEHSTCIFLLLLLVNYKNIYFKYSDRKSSQAAPGTGSMIRG